MIIVPVFRHLGPGPHPSGSPQSIHGKPGLAVHEDVPTYTESQEAEYAAPLDEEGMADVKAANQFIKDEFTQWASGLDKKTVIALDDYASQGFSLVNRYLRKVKTPSMYKSFWNRYEDFRGQLADIERVFGNARTHLLSRPALVYRGMSNERLGDLKEGDTYQDRAYLSTSLVKPQQIGNMFDKGAVCVIHLPKGTRCAVTDIGYEKRDVGKDLENEVLLPRYSKLRLNKKWAIPGDIRTYYDFTYLGSNDQEHLSYAR